MADKKPDDAEIQFGPNNADPEDTLEAAFSVHRQEVTEEMLEQHAEEGEEGKSPAGGAAPASEPEPEIKEPEPEVKLEPEKKEEPAQPRFKSQEEAEKAHAEAEKRMTTAAQDAAEVRRANERLEQELAELRAKPPEVKPEEKPAEAKVTPEEREAKVLEIAKAANLKAVRAIRDLDSSDEDYNDRVAAAWAVANQEVLKAAIEASQAPQVNQADIEAIVQKQLKVSQDAADVAKAAAEKVTAQEEAWNTAVDFGTKAGLALNDPESADSDLFEAAERKIPQEMLGKGFTPEIGEFMVNYVRTRTGKVVSTKAERDAAALKIQQENSSLPKGGSRPKPKTETQEEGGTLNDAFRIAGQRRIM